MTAEKKILIIDDDPDAIVYLQAILEDNGYETVTANNGEEGLKKAQEIRPCMILLDLMMPKKSGVKFLNEIKQTEGLEDVPIVVQSGARQVTGVDMKQYLQDQPFKDRKKKSLGVDIDITPQAFLEKPINPSDLLETVKKFV